jgi:hypothetical protein
MPADNIMDIGLGVTGGAGLLDAYYALLANAQYWDYASTTATATINNNITAIVITPSSGPYLPPKPAGIIWHDTPGASGSVSALALFEARQVSLPTGGSGGSTWAGGAPSQLSVNSDTGVTTYGMGGVLAGVNTFLVSSDSGASWAVAGHPSIAIQTVVPGITVSGTGGCLVGRDVAGTSYVYSADGGATWAATTAPAFPYGTEIWFY